MIKKASLIITCVLLCSCSHSKNLTPTKKAVYVEHVNIRDDTITENLQEEEDWLGANTLISQDGTVLYMSDATEAHDPLEMMNRVVFGFNKIFDVLLLKNVALLYEYAVPHILKTFIKNFLNNMYEPMRMVYGVLVLDGEIIQTSFQRFLFNSTFGAFGLYDVVEIKFQNLKVCDISGDKVLENYNVERGPYLMMPILGPMFGRQFLGKVMSFVFNPFTYILPQQMTTGKFVTEGVISRADVLDLTNTLTNDSIDEYATLRSLYSQTTR